MFLIAHDNSGNALHQVFRWDQIRTETASTDFFGLSPVQKIHLQILKNEREEKVLIDYVSSNYFGSEQRDDAILDLKSNNEYQVYSNTMFL